MTHDEMVEAVARAICHARHGKTRGYAAHDEEYMAEARAALAVVYGAMREPTDAMMDAGWKALGLSSRERKNASAHLNPLVGTTNEPAVAYRWRAMIDASPLPSPAQTLMAGTKARHAANMARWNADPDIAAVLRSCTGRGPGGGVFPKK